MASGVKQHFFFILPSACAGEVSWRARAGKLPYKPVRTMRCRRFDSPRDEFLDLMKSVDWFPRIRLFVKADLGRNLPHRILKILPGLRRPRLHTDRFYAFVS